MHNEWLFAIELATEAGYPEHLMLKKSNSLACSVFKGHAHVLQQRMPRKFSNTNTNVIYDLRNLVELTVKKIRLVAFQYFDLFHLVMSFEMNNFEWKYSTPLFSKFFEHFYWILEWVFSNKTTLLLSVDLFPLCVITFK